MPRRVLQTGFISVLRLDDKELKTTVKDNDKGRDTCYVGLLLTCF